MEKVEVFYVESKKGLHHRTLMQADAEREATRVYQESGVIAEINARMVKPKDWTST